MDAEEIKAFIPMAMATSLPTMPHRDAEQACRTILDHFPEAPCAPRLTLSARMYMDAMPCLVVSREKRSLHFDLTRQSELEKFYEKYLSGDIEHFKIYPENGPGFYKMLDLLKSENSLNAKLILTQMPGILTWGLSLRDLQGTPAWYNETMRDVLIKTLIMKAKWQEKKIAEVVPKARMIVTLGEPSLGVVSSAFGSVTEQEVIKAIDEIFEQVEGFTCVHCCSNMDWSQLTRTKTNIINFDAYQYSEKISLYPKEMESFLQKGGMLAWGIVPVFEEIILSENLESLVQKLEQGIGFLMAKGLGKQIILERSFITPCCTTAMLTIELAEKVFRYTQEISQVIRKRLMREV